MNQRIITITLLGTFCAQADMLTSTQRFFGMGGQVPEYVDNGESVEPSALGQAPYSPADSDLGIQEVLVERGPTEPLIFDFNTSVSRTDNAPSGNPVTDEPSWVSSSRMSLTWRPHLVYGWFGDVGVGQDLVRYDQGDALDYEDMNLRMGVFKSLPDLDDTVLFARYEYQRITFTSLGDGEYNAQRIRAGLQKTLWAVPGHHLTGSLSGAYEWTARPEILERNETAVDLAYRCSITDSLHAVVSARVARFNFDEFGRDDWTFGSGVELIWRINPNFKATASVFYDKNDSDGIGNFNEYQSWTSGVGVGLRWMF